MYVNRLILVGKLHKEAKYDGGLATIGIEHDGLMMRVIVDDKMLMSSIQDDLKEGCTVVVEGKLGMDGHSIVAMVSTERSDNLRVILDRDGRPVFRRRLADLAGDRTYERDRVTLDAARERVGDKEVGREDSGDEDAGDAGDAVDEGDFPGDRETRPPAQTAPTTPAVRPVAAESAQASGHQSTATSTVPPRQAPPGRPVVAPARPPTPGRPLTPATNGTQHHPQGATEHRPPPRQFVTPPSQQHGGRPQPTSPGLDDIDSDIPF